MLTIVNMGNNRNDYILENNKYVCKVQMYIRTVYIQCTVYTNQINKQEWMCTSVEECEVCTYVS